MVSGGGLYNAGCIFSIDTNGSGYKDLFDFNGTNGSAPLGSLTLSGGILYGMTMGGGNGVGLVFSIDTNGSGYRDLFNFNGINGSYPQGSLILSGKVLYGMTTEDGLYGNIFSIDTNGSDFSNLYSFDGSGFFGEDPKGSLILFGSKLYGMTSGGNSSLGNVFSIDTNGNSYTDLFNFDAYDGGAPYGSLTLSLSGNKLYGMTYIGGSSGYGCGNIFLIDTNGSGDSGIYHPGLRELYDFDFSTGADPWGDLTLSGNMLYGMTNRGGTDSVGVIFKLDTNALVTASINNITTNKEAINVYPNPSKGVFTISLGHAELVSASQPIVEIYNALGEKIYVAALKQVQGDNPVNISNQPNGVYLYRIINQQNNSIFSDKFIIQK